MTEKYEEYNLKAVSLIKKMIANLSVDEKELKDLLTKYELDLVADNTSHNFIFPKLQNDFTMYLYEHGFSISKENMQLYFELSQLINKAGFKVMPPLIWNNMQMY